MISAATRFMYLNPIKSKIIVIGQATSIRRIMQSAVQNSAELLEMVRSVVPKLSHDLHKGSCGRIAVIGGCQEYTGAPYFAAISALKVGADLSHVFCTQSAAPVIKSYSPELIVHPVLDREDAVEEVCKWLPRMHSLVVGPGLGRDEHVLDNVKGVMEAAKSQELPMVIDADGLFYVTQNPDIMKDYKKAILTPNKMEFSRLQAVMEKKPGEDPVEDTLQLSRALGNVTVLQKGFNDVISDGHKVLACCGPSSPRRCGGQGDLLSGSIGTFLYWAHRAVDAGTNNVQLEGFGPEMCAAYAGSLLTRECNGQAFRVHGRSTTTSDMISKIGVVFSQLYEHRW